MAKAGLIASGDLRKAIAEHQRILVRRLSSDCNRHTTGNLASPNFRLLGSNTALQATLEFSNASRVIASSRRSFLAVLRDRENSVSDGCAKPDAGPTASSLVVVHRLGCVQAITLALSTDITLAPM